MPSAENAAFLPSIDENVTQFDAGGMHLEDDIRPGALIELRRSDAVRHGIILSFGHTSAAKLVMSLTTTGEIIAHLPNDIMFCIPGYVSSSTVARCGPELLPRSPTETRARLDVIKSVRSFEDRVERTFTSVQRKASLIYDHFRSQNPQEWSEITVRDAAKLVLGTDEEPSRELLFALQKYMMDRSTHFVADVTNMMHTQRFLLRPLAEVDNIIQVSDWLRNNDPVLTKFVNKARTIIMQSRNLAKKTWASPPGVEDQKLTQFTSSDFTILQFLYNGFNRKRFIQSCPYESLLPKIIQSTGLYEGDITAATVFQFLKEVGVCAPWEDIVTHGLSRELSIGRPKESSEPKVIESWMNAVLPPVSHGSTPATLEMCTRDGLESVRHDFGDMPVYSIDDHTAEEIDDGLSIEPATDSPGSFWVHVHIADPTSIIRPGDAMARVAEARHTTAYFVQQTWPMLPSTLTQKYLSLDAASPSSPPLPVLTFSMKVDETGDVTDHKVRAGLVRNTQSLTYDAVDRALGAKILHVKTYPFLNIPPPLRQPHPISENVVGALRQFQLVRDRLYGKRSQAPGTGLLWALPRVEVRLTGGTPLPTSPPIPHQPILYRGFPELEYCVQSGVQLTPARRMVEEFMITAGRVAARFCTEKGIPSLYRTLSRGPGATDEALAQIDATRDELGNVDPYLVGQLMLTGGNGYQSSPGEHWQLGLGADEGYMQVTSPLRRFNDMVCHWQIKSALRPTSSGIGRSASAAASTPIPKDQIELMTKTFPRLDREKKQNGRSNARFWALSYIQRWMQHPGTLDAPDPLQNLEARTVAYREWDPTSRSYSLRAVIPTLGLQAIIRNVVGEPADIGASYKVKIDSIDLGLIPKMYLALAK
ncbi:hypothetical protein BOTBODRAFT_102693 [Botryobasidium botryosum FD-172 SS1]|uniref:RNB domain-containing protein n=1 Tax=Botryobasidium botryosum (strain FD-172 SS1) TaxID=930990 RepID=A0A067MUR9_BOTB1|nr:hypothetical protein BOTBODRAFT_102693 [Botryobasidium botryosum FD-172 SS1]